jgi:NAD(P)-dependent dehydrogenase (short-subunit alcohol dehydrogenase family)
MGSLQQSYELAKDSLEINFNGTKHVTDCLIPLLLLSKSGRVVNVSSQVAQLKVTFKSGAEGFAKKKTLCKQANDALHAFSFFSHQFMSNEGAIKVLSDIDNLSEAKLDEVMSSFMEDFKDGNLAARGWLPVVSAYAVSKALVNAHSRLLARRHPSLVVCCVTPGFVRTGMNYGMGLVSAEEGAAAPVALALRAEPADSGLNFELLDVCEF